MATYIKGNPVANATSYKLFDKNGSNYTQIAEESEINFEVSALGLSSGEHTLAVKACASGYADSDYSNEVVYHSNASVSVIDEIFSNMAWTIGKTPEGGKTGLSINDARYVCMSEPYNTNGETISINNPNTSLYQCIISICDADGKHTSYDGAQLSAATWTMTGNVRMCLKFKDDRNMTEALWQTLKAELLAAN